MSSHSRWDTLIPRLEADLLARERSAGTVLDDVAWELARALLRTRGRVLLVTHSGLAPEDVDDIVQDVLIKLQSLERLRRLRLAGSVDGYLVVMMRNAATDLVRRRQREQAYVRSWRPELGAAEIPDIFESAALDRGTKLREALQSLTADERNLLRMRFWRGMSIGEIADEIHVSYSAAAVRLFRTLHRLRTHMGCGGSP